MVALVLEHNNFFVLRCHEDCFLHWACWTRWKLLFSITLKKAFRTCCRGLLKTISGGSKIRK